MIVIPCWWASQLGTFSSEMVEHVRFFAILLVLAIVGVVSNGLGYDSGIKNQQDAIQSIIDKCQEKLPRDKNCIIIAVPKESVHNDKKED